jgi:hypothetical protein
MTDKMPKMFIGSSSESSNYLTKIEKQLKDVVEFNAWNKQVFNPAFGNYLSDIIKGIEKSNCALFLFASDDKRVMRGKEESVTRDNVIFETGIAIGLLGKERVFIIAEKDTALPKDLDGLTVFKIYPDATGSFDESLKFETNRLKEKLISLKDQFDKSPVFLNEYIPEKIKKGVLTAKTIFAISPMLSSFLDNHEADIRNRLNDKSNPIEKFVAVVRDPDGNTLGLISKHNNLNSEPKSIHKKISASISILQKLKHSFPDKVEIRVIDHPFMCSSYVFDPETDNCKICIQYNPFGEVDRLPQIFVPSSRPFWNDFYLKQSNEYLINSKEYPAKYSTLLLNDSCEFEEKKSLLSLWEEGYKKIGAGYRGQDSAIDKLKKDTLLVFAKDNDRLIGFSIIETKTGKRRATVIDKMHRAKGIATDLIRISLEIVPNQFSEVHLYSKGMQIVFAKNGFKKVSSESEIKTILNNQDIDFDYDKKKDILKYKRKTTKGQDSDWLILYKK